VLDLIENRAAISDSSTPSVVSDRAEIPLVGVGASAGGLQPIQRYFELLGDDVYSAFVVVQHLSPHFRSLMDELLARYSRLRIRRIDSVCDIEAGTIYLNQPRTTIEIVGNTLTAKRDDVEERAVARPIDHFFTSLASARRDQAVGLVFSGTGTDGMRGSGKILDAGGSVLVQDPGTAQFDGMPLATINSGFYSFSGPIEHLVEQTGLLLAGKDLTETVESDLVQAHPYDRILSSIQLQFGADLRHYKESTIRRRIARRAKLAGACDIADYATQLATDARELDVLYADLLIEVTTFFRDADAFKVLASTAISNLCSSSRNSNEPIRVWVPGCASGEEAYSIAILFAECSLAIDRPLNLKVLATDIHGRSMNQASAGIYSLDALSSVPAELVDRYFDVSRQQAVVKPFLRSYLFFSTHDLLNDPPFIDIDLVSCRNLLIYLKNDSQQQAMQSLLYAMRPGGFMMLGPSERLESPQSEYFEVVDDNWRIFHRNSMSTPKGSRLRQKIAGGMRKGVTPSSDSSLPFDRGSLLFRRAKSEALENLVKKLSQPGFLITGSGDIEHIFGEVSDLIPLKPGSFSKNVVDLVHPELKTVVSIILEQLPVAQDGCVERNVNLGGIEDVDGRTINIRAEHLCGLQEESHKFYLLLISDRSRFLGVSDAASGEEDNSSADQLQSERELREKLRLLQQTLNESESNLRATIEELETSNEELQSTNEELMSANEELQSTNEELHSVNEELYSVSAEHQQKNRELIERDREIEALLQSAKIGTVHLDEKLCLVRYSEDICNLFNIMPQDLGRPINHLTIKSNEREITDAIARCASEMSDETVELDVSVQGKTYLVRITGKAGSKGKESAGVLITCIDITDRRYMEDQARTLATIVEKTRTFVARWDADTKRVTYSNYHFARQCQFESADGPIGQLIQDVLSASACDWLKKRADTLKVDESLTDMVQGFNINEPDASSLVTLQALAGSSGEVSGYQCVGFPSLEENAFTLALNEMQTSLSESKSPETLIDKVISALVRYLQFEVGFVSIRSDDGSHQVRHAVDVLGDITVSQINASISDAVLEELNENGGITIASKDLASDSLAEALSQLRAQFVIASPVKNFGGAIGTLCLMSRRSAERNLTYRDKNFVYMVCAWIGFILDQEKYVQLIRHQTEYYKSLLHAIPGLMFLLDSDGRILTASERLCQLLGLELAQVKSKHVDDYLPDGAASKSYLQSNVVNQRNRLLLPNGSSTEVELSSVQCTVGVQQLRLVMLTDVSKRLEVQAELEAQNEQLSQANESLNRFAFVASHDLQEPLRKIQQFGSFLVSDLGDQLSTDSRYHLDVITTAAERMSKLIYDLLQFSRMSRETPTLDDVDLNDLVKSCITNHHEKLIEVNGVAETIDLPRSIRGNRVMLEQMINNLISNSIKYRSDDRSLNITVSGGAPDSREMFSFVDNGVGLDSKKTERIFEPFYRLDNKAAVKGSGVGLAICALVCEKHGWSIHCSGSKGEGCRFTIVEA
jgi:PAS domain S-box-containing protein